MSVNAELKLGVTLLLITTEDSGIAVSVISIIASTVEHHKLDLHHRTTFRCRL